MIQTYTIRQTGIKRKTVELLFLVGLFAGSICIIFLTRNVPLLYLAAIIFVSSGWSYSYVSKARENPVPYFETALAISESEISIGNSTYKLADVSNLRFEIREFDGQERVLDRSRFILNGTNNVLSFKYVNQIIRVQFYIISEGQKDDFKRLFEYWYINAIPFYEGDAGGKTFLLDKLSYQEIQGFKLKYGRK